MSAISGLGGGWPAVLNQSARSNQPLAARNNQELTAAGGAERADQTQAQPTNTQDQITNRVRNHVPANPIRQILEHRPASQALDNASIRMQGNAGQMMAEGNAFVQVRVGDQAAQAADETQLKAAELQDNITNQTRNHVPVNPIRQIMDHRPAAQALDNAAFQMQANAGQMMTGGNAFVEERAADQGQAPPPAQERPGDVLDIVA